MDDADVPCHLPEASRLLFLLLCLLPKARQKSTLEAFHQPLHSLVTPPVYMAPRVTPRETTLVCVVFPNHKNET